MISYVKGSVADIDENIVVVENNGIGYNINITSRDAQNIGRRQSEVCFYTYLNVREDAMQLFGFLSKDDLKMFKLLLGVSGVGPKASLGILSALPADDLRFAVLADDVKSISAAPGIGKKTAQKLILELKDKFDLQTVFEDKLSANTSAAPVDASEESQNEAVQALVALGYSGTDALRAVRAAAGDGQLSTEELLKAALKNM